ncbi:FecR family protein [Sphingobacterium yanglingense]|uniref:FecR family protein n=1 Tax=Sphingobacterium yanglingense TaxID=1437280 RepID=A0A4R6WE59_9SPHI|nr:FecR family protein [Sphingobacterium yanglingense]TDQ75736.1 FecR family protein [Sphingobacterium yanglingense]
MNELRLKLLLVKYADNTISKSELVELLAELNRGDLDYISNLVEDYEPDALDGLFEFTDSPHFDQEQGFYRLKRNLNLNKAKTKRIVVKIISGIAASLLIALGIYIFYAAPSETLDSLADADITLPDENHATVTLVDHTKYSLLHTPKEILAKEGIQVIRDQDGKAVFKISETDEPELNYRKIKAAKGMDAKVLLFDGTAVLLNSSSSLTYPSRFLNSGRSVVIEGEGFFEVAHNALQPFVVSAGISHIKVLGTTFNVATNIVDNKVLTTLVSGSVEVSTNWDKVRIKPGMQSVSDNLSGELSHKEVLIQDVLAWKEGYFRFNRDDIATVLDKIKNWYEITDYEIRGKSKDHFTGSIKRTQKLSDILKQLEKISNYKFKIVGRRVVAMS